MEIIPQLNWQTLPKTGAFTRTLPEEVAQWILLNQHTEACWTKFPNRQLEGIPEAVLSFQLKLIDSLSNKTGVVRIQLNASLEDAALRILYAGIASLIGRLNDRYGYFFDVIDHGLDYTKEAIPVSKTNAETGFHTDSTAHNYFPDVVGLLCLHAAPSGGDSLVVNASNLYYDLLQNKPEWKAIMHQPIFRDVITPGAEQSLQQIRENAFPLFQVNENTFVFRYMRYWITSAYQKLQVEFPTGLEDLLNYIDAYFADSNNVLQFRMNRGDAVFVNNRFLCHNRTKFQDGINPRRLVRTWINLD